MTTPQPRDFCDAIRFLKAYQLSGFHQSGKQVIPDFGHEFFGCSSHCYPYYVGLYYAACVEIVLKQVTKESPKVDRLLAFFGMVLIIAFILLLIGVA